MTSINNNLLKRKVNLVWHEKLIVSCRTKHHPETVLITTVKFSSLFSVNLNSSRNFVLENGQEG